MIIAVMAVTGRKQNASAGIGPDRVIMPDPIQSVADALFFFFFFSFFSSSFLSFLFLLFGFVFLHASTCLVDLSHISGPEISIKETT